MDKKTLEEMRLLISERLKEGQQFMEAKKAVLNIYRFQGEERALYSSLLSSHFGAKGGRSSAEKRRQKKEVKKFLELIYKEIMIEEAIELERQEAIRAGHITE